ncbi:potassium channel family protein [Asticcacaulis sp. BYS171W]|uniref:Potassium channel family protein n=1 Tax=Asticcacaulis aquaticus TaxID=2984212 RepID=A0ABT5HUG3_9CAUL|nr:potassium channel family protein [Asticcacaulis aquaticus]MDC7683716.1 potassium channel family protein [Asticcacaulis aquaticus]
MALRPRKIDIPDEVLPAITLNRKGKLPIWQSLVLRAVLVFLLIGIALIGHLSDREGLRDNTDGEVSFVDVVYFTAVTVSTVGYGDIVPVTDKARLFDTFVVTPIRLFIWLIFLGTAYSFVVKSTWERIRTHMIRKGLKGHIIVYGYGASGEAAVNELLRQNMLPERIVVVDYNGDRIAAALERGVTTIDCDATHNSTQAAANIDTAQAVIVSTGRDDTTALVVLSARAMNPHVSISATVRAVENESLIRQAGADHIINPVSFGGHLLARAAEGRHVVDYISDLASADGKVVMRDRVVTSAEVGKPLSAITTGLGVRICRGDHQIGYWEPEAQALRAGDVIVEIAQTRPLSPLP